MDYALKSVEIEEGFRDRLYKCTEGKLTIGYGFNLEATPLPEPIARIWLREILTNIRDRFEKEKPWFLELSDIRKAAVINMVYQLGWDGFGNFKKFQKYLIEKDYKKASIEMLDSLWARQTPLRAMRLSKLIQLDDFTCYDEL